MKIRRTINFYTVNVEITKEDGATTPDFLLYSKMPSARQIKGELEMKYGRSDGNPVNYRVIKIIPSTKVMEMDIEKFVENAVEVNE